jgi:ribosomal protein L37E
MNVSTTDETTTGVTERCGQCGAQTAHDQRYCLNCGFHRRNARDPVARYLSEASAARSQVAAAHAAAAARRGRLPRLGARAVSLLVVIALLVGILIGNATGGGSSAPARRTSTATTQSATVTNATGSKYLQQEQNLPNTVSP